MVEEFDWRKVAASLDRMVKKEMSIYSGATGKKVKTWIGYSGYGSYIDVDIMQERLLMNRLLAAANVAASDNPSENRKKGDMHFVVKSDDMRPHARKICEEYEKELKFRTFLNYH